MEGEKRDEQKNKNIFFLYLTGFAVAQFIVAILMFRGLIFKRGTDKQKMPRAGFAIMKTVLTLRNIFKKPERTLREMRIQKGQTVGGTTPGIKIGWSSLCYR